MAKLTKSSAISTINSLVEDGDLRNWILSSLSHDYGNIDSSSSKGPDSEKSPLSSSSGNEESNSAADQTLGRSAQVPDEVDQTQIKCFEGIGVDEHHHHHHNEEVEDDELEEVYELDDELVPWFAIGKVGGKQRMNKLGKRECPKKTYEIGRAHV